MVLQHEIPIRHHTVSTRQAPSGCVPSIPSSGLREAEGLANYFLSFDGDMIVTLDTGFSVTLPNELLVVPHVYIDQETGDIVAEDGDEPDLLIDAMQDVNENDMAMFGSAFFSAAYLTVNVDAGKFKLWSANTTGNLNQDLRALNDENEDITTICEAGGDSTVQSNSTETAPTESVTPSGSADQAGGLGTGAKVGIAVGVVAAAAAALGALAMYLLRKKKRAAYMAAQHEASSGSGSNNDLTDGQDPAPGTGGRQDVAVELQSSPFIVPRSELHEDSVRKYELQNSPFLVPRELHEDSVRKYEMPDTGPPIRYELAS